LNISHFLSYFSVICGLPRDYKGGEKGMQITVGSLREDNLFDYKFVGLSHNTLRGAAGGAVLTAELIKKLGYLD